MQEPAQTRARMHHKHKHARNINPRFGGSLEGCGCSCRQVLEVASFVPGHVRNRGATPWSWTALCSKRNKVATPFHSNRVERRRHDAPCAGARTFALEPHRTARPARRARARRLPRPNLTRFRITTDYACQDVSAAAEKRARWNCRWRIQPESMNKSSNETVGIVSSDSIAIGRVPMDLSFNSPRSL